MPIPTGAYQEGMLESPRTGEYYFTCHGQELADYSATDDVLHAMPLVVARDMTIDRIAAHVDTAGAAGTKARLGIYKTGDNLYPGDLVIDAGEIAIDAIGVQTLVIDQALFKGIYYTVLVHNDAGGGVRFKGFLNAFSPPLSISSSLLSQYWGMWTGAFAYAVLEDPAPAGLTLLRYYVISVPVRIASLD